MLYTRIPVALCIALGGILMGFATIENDFYLAGLAAGVLVTAALFVALDQLIVNLTAISRSLDELKADLRKR